MQKKSSLGEKNQQNPCINNKKMIQLCGIEKTSCKGRGGRESCNSLRRDIYASGSTSARVDIYCPSFTHKPPNSIIKLSTRLALRSWAFSHKVDLLGLLAHFSLCCKAFSHIQPKKNHKVKRCSIYKKQ